MDDLDDVDRANIMFILSSTPQQLEVWYATLSEEDLEYAHTLLAYVNWSVIDAAVDRMTMYREARAYLSKYTDTLR